MTTKYDYIGRFQVSGIRGDDALPATLTNSLSEAISYLSRINNGELRATALVENKEGKLVVMEARLGSDAVIGRGETRIYEMLDRDLDAQLEALEKKTGDS